MGKIEKVEVELADRFKIVLHNKDMHAGCFYAEDEWDITIYAPTIEDLIAQATVAMILQLIRVDYWELDRCQVLIYNGNIYEIKDSAKDIQKEYSALVDDITSMESYEEAYKEAYKMRQEERKVELRKIRAHYSRRKIRMREQEEK